jgi:hypothetical protein
LAIIAQATNAQDATPQYFLYDGHGSTRQLLEVNAQGNLVTVEQHVYDAYGVAINFNSATAATRILYSGEYTHVTGQQYLRARY